MPIKLRIINLFDFNIPFGILPTTKILGFALTAFVSYKIYNFTTVVVGKIADNKQFYYK